MNDFLINLGYPSFKLFQELKHLTIIYNRTGQTGDAELDLTDEDTLEDVIQIGNTLRYSGLKVKVFGLHEKNIDNLFKIKTDFIFNLCYGIGSIPDSEKQVYELFDKLKIPYSGGPGDAVLSANDKSQSKKLFIKNQLPTAKFVTVKNVEELNIINLKYPLFVKTLDLGCSMGIDQQSVVLNQLSLKNKVKSLLEKYKKPLIVEEFIDGREFAVTIVGSGKNCLVLPIVEIAYGPLFEKNNRWKIFDYDTKWNQLSPFYIDSPYKCPAYLDQKLENKIKDISLKAYRVSYLRDYIRIDIRDDNHGNPYILEINPNPSIGKHSQVHKSAMVLGLTFKDMIKMLICISLKRFYGNTN